MHTPLSSLVLPPLLREQIKAFQKKRFKHKAFRVAVEVDTGNPAYKTDIEVYVFCPHGMLAAYYNESQRSTERLKFIHVESGESFWQAVADSLYLSAIVYCCEMYRCAAGEVVRHKLNLTWKPGKVVNAKIVEAGRDSYILQ